MVVRCRSRRAIGAARSSHACPRRLVPPACMVLGRGDGGCPAPPQRRRRALSASVPTIPASPGPSRGFLVGAPDTPSDRSSSRGRPVQGARGISQCTAAIASSEVCGSCHSCICRSFRRVRCWPDLQQATYPEWAFSAYRVGRRPTATCHPARRARNPARLPCRPERRRQLPQQDRQHPGLIRRSTATVPILRPLAAYPRRAERLPCEDSTAIPRHPRPPDA